jgi:hypothetical protein
VIVPNIVQVGRVFPEEAADALRRFRAFNPEKDA